MTGQRACVLVARLQLPSSPWEGNYGCPPAAPAAYGSRPTSFARRVEPVVLETWCRVWLDGQSHAQSLRAMLAECGKAV